MKLDARSLPRAHLLETDLCIVGAGAAGITIAREFANLHIRVLLLESGDLTASADTLSLNQGDIVGEPYFPLDSCRLRFFGGTTNHWGGWCRPPQAHDFEPRAWIPDSGWPFPKTELDPFFVRGHTILELGEYNYEPAYWERGRNKRLPLDPRGLKTVITQFSPPTRFGIKYRDDVIKPDNVTLLVNADALTIEANDTQIQRIHCGTLAGNRFTVSARHYVLAMGGIENARVLLLSVQKNGIALGNKHDLVGRYFADSFVSTGGEIQFSREDLPLGFYRRHESRGQMIKAYLKPSAQQQEKLGLTTITYTLIPVFDAFYDKASRSEGVESLLCLAGSIKAGAIPDNLDTHLYNIIGDIDDVAATVYRKLRHGRVPISRYKFFIGQDCAPNRESQVRLGTRTDPYGLRRVELDWKLTQLDRDSFLKAQNLLAQEFGRQGLGRVKIYDYDSKKWPEIEHNALMAGRHHLGTTRMHRDPRRGVVDADSKVHGIENLHIAGSSVFPNFEGTPTLTIVSLSLRLADHLKSIFRET